MDVREKVMYSDYVLDGMQASAERYVRLYADPLKVGVNVRSKYGPGEPFYILARNSCSSSVPKNVPFFISYSQLNVLRRGNGRIYGRMERDSRFYILDVYCYEIFQLKTVFYDQEDIRKLVYEE